MTRVDVNVPDHTPQITRNPPGRGRRLSAREAAGKERKGETPPQRKRSLKRLTDGFATAVA